MTEWTVHECLATMSLVSRAGSTARSWIVVAMSVRTRLGVIYKRVTFFLRRDP